MDPDETLTLPPPHLLFASITYYIAPSFPPLRIEELDAVLQEYGASRAEGGVKDEKLTTVISNSPRWEGWEEVGEEGRIDVVTDKWVERSVVLGKMQLAQHFSTNPAMLFSGVVACSTSDLPATDLEVLSAGITALGGQWRTGLTKDVTHLFALTPNSGKYATAMHYIESTKIKVVLPHWFDDAVRLGTGRLSTEPYEWPEVRVLKGVEGLVGGPEVDEVKRNMYATAAIFTPGMADATPPLQEDINLLDTATADRLASSPVHGVNRSALALQPGEGVWAGRKIVLSRTLQLYRGRREAVQAGIERAGGVVLRFDGDEEEEEAPIEIPPEKEKEAQGPTYKLHMNERRRRRSEAEKISECDVLVTRWRFGRAYVLAVRSTKTIGTLAWLFHVQSTGILSRPLDQLLHYPVPKRIIESFHNHVITVTNYTGEAREYLKKLISAMGATFTPSMSGQNTALIAAYTSGTKAMKARSWSIPVVNHTWLEDCFIQWRNLTPALEKYIVFPEGVDFAKMLGERGVFVGPVGGGKKSKSNNDDDNDERFEIPKDRIELEADELYPDGEAEVSSDVEMGPPPASEGHANGAEEAEVLEELAMDVDEDREREDVVPKSTPKLAKLASPTKPPKSSPVSKPTPTPTPKPIVKSKPTRKPEVVEEVIELDSSGSEEEGAAEVQVKANGKGKAKAVEEDAEEDEDERRTTKKPKSPLKPTTTKPTKSKPKPASDDEDDEEAPTPPSKTPNSNPKASGLISKKRLPISSVESSDEPQEDKIESGSEDQDHEELQMKDKAKKLKRRFSVASVSNVDDAEEEEEEEMPQPKTKTKTKPKSAPKPTKPAKSIPKPTKTTKHQPIPPPASSSENEEESVVVISKPKTKPKAKVSPAKPSNLASGSNTKAAPTPSAGGLLNRVRGDARTRVKKRVSKGEETAKAKVVESEDEEEEEEEAPKAKSKAKAKDVKGKKAKKAATPSTSEAEEEEEEEEEEPQPARASSSKTKSKVATTPTRTKPLRVYSENDEDDSEISDEEEFPSPRLAFSKATGKSASAKKTVEPTSTSKSKSKSKDVVEPLSTKSKPKAKSKATKAATSESESGTQSDVPPAPPTKKTAKAKDGKKTTAQVVGPSTPRRVVSVLMPTLSISGGRGDRGQQKSKASGKGKKRVVIDEGNDEEEDEESDAEEVTLKGKGKARAKGVAAPDEPEERGKTKAKAKPDPNTRTNSAVKSKSKSNAKHPHVTSDEEDTNNEEQEELLISPRTRAMTRTDSMRVVSAQVNIPSPSVAITSAKAKVKSTKKVAKEKENRSTVQHRYRQRPPSPSSADRDTPMDVDSHPVASTSAPVRNVNALTSGTSSVQSTPISGSLPRRSAATKATQRLHESIMPDVMQYEAQMKRSRSTKGRGSAAAAFVVEGDGGRERKDKEREKEKRKHVDDGDERSKKKRRVSEEPEEEVKEVETKSKSKSSKGKERIGVIPMDVDEDDASSSAKVRVMTTQISLGDDVTKALTKLGVTFTTRPNECTHLIAQGVVRTEKFLCAVAMRTYILSEKWAIASAHAKKLLAEKDFPLKDKVGEEKYNVDLAKALRLSKQNKGRMLQGHTFYVTPRVSIDTKLLKNVVNACGGQVTTQTPTLRIINASPETRHVISCKEDISIWRPLAAQGIKVYTQELVLEGALRQEMDWDKESFLVKV